MTPRAIGNSLYYTVHANVTAPSGHGRDRRSNIRTVPAKTGRLATMHLHSWIPRNTVCNQLTLSVTVITKSPDGHPQSLVNILTLSQQEIPQSLDGTLSHHCSLSVTRRHSQSPWDTSIDQGTLEVTTVTLGH